MSTRFRSSSCWAQRHVVLLRHHPVGVEDQEPGNRDNQERGDLPVPGKLAQPKVHALPSFSVGLGRRAH